MSVSHKVKPDRSVFDTAKMNHQGRRQDIAWTELSKRPTMMLQVLYMAHEFLP